ncbi:Uncharacterised protein [Mycobacteroides abscessus subsp. massiliense]|uniref:hypothetical protein n=1 Tax=Paenibacillus TaxID=44249 RepID=UPI0004167B16|nr:MULTISPECIES: hypothetical protein [Paenibacillus]KGP81538.1 hypothetical protein P364_0116075 [Paenibacillus sp. MAEPY2]KGP86182.1 hypothetical protein P363_0118840 [Paenibacillus sp. MAEPY1]OZQ60407.1 hypothetical protein CA599_30315 [Paenibacillus taichungensis]SKQ05902.1 Uncharacterised protein [Mycobacteroides abscessus subsp. massiliense]
MDSMELVKEIRMQLHEMKKEIEEMRKMRSELQEDSENFKRYSILLEGMVRRESEMKLIVSSHVKKNIRKTIQEHREGQVNNCPVLKLVK